MKPNEIKKYLHEFALYGCIEFSIHCRKRMVERKVTSQDIQNVLMWAEKITKINQDPDFPKIFSCRVKGKDIDGDELIFVAEIDLETNSVLCISVF